MRIITRAEWGAAPPRLPLIANGPWPELDLHHTDTPPGGGAQRIREIQRQHQRHLGRDVAYNFLVSTSGVFEGLGAGKRHLNTGAGRSGTIALVGRHHLDPVPAIVVERTAWLIVHGALSGWWPLGITHLHRQRSKTECPGDYAVAALPGIAAHVRRIIAGLHALNAAPKGAPTMVIIRRPDGHHELSDGLRRRPIRNTDELAKWRAAGAPVVDLTIEEWSLIEPVGR